ncbi:MAG: cytochrome c-type biogenesis protein CcmH [Sinobacteraceae bacterium]|nr:cytochrome c-type biogenesis protein CcmH [Nevskiaceae bacterium]
MRACQVGLLALLLSNSALAIDPIELSDPALQERYRDLTHELRCMQCQNQSIADSPVGLAGDLRREVRELLESGKTDAEIREHLRARYGDFILFRPVFNWRNAWLWAAPVILLLAGLVVAVRVLRQRARLAATDTTSPDDPAP